MGRHHHTDTHSQALFFLIGINFCERCNYYAIKGIFSIYLTERLMFSEHVTTLVYHTFVMVLYTTPLFGAIISEACLGKYKTILCSAFVYALGNMVLTLSAIRAFQLPETLLGVVALTLLAIGTGGLNPIALDFGGDQFNLPKQHKEMDAYYHFFHFIINVGSFLALLLAPMMRRHVHCFGEESCYALAFFIPAALTVLAICITVFRSGKPLYRMAPPEGSMEGRIIACIYTALRNKCKRGGIKKSHWLDYAVEDYGEELVNDTKEVLAIFLVFLPLPIFWALYEQQATSWTFQARHLSGACGDHITILADQMQVANPALVLLLFPLFEYIIYPCFSCIRLLRTPLQRMAIGCLFAALSFVLASSLQYEIEHLDVRSLAPEKSVIQIFSVHDCNVSVKTNYIGSYTYDLDPMGFSSYACNNFARQAIIFKGTCHQNADLTNGSLPEVGKYLTCYSFKQGCTAVCELDDGLRLMIDCRVKFLVNFMDGVMNTTFFIRLRDHGGNVYKEFPSNNQSFYSIAPGRYGIEFRCSMRYYVTFKAGSVYAVGAVAKLNSLWVVKAQEIFPPEPAIHMMALVPQYAAMAAAEIMFTISGLDFAYDEAPDHMKTVVEILWLLGIAIGQIVVIVLEIMKPYDQQYMYLLYAMMMAGATVVFIFISCCCFGYHHLFGGQADEEHDD